MHILVAGTFDFEKIQEFRNAYEKSDANPRSWVVDLGETDHIDSSALGMLLVMKEYVEARGSTMVVANARGAVLKLLQVANYERLFELV